MKNDIAKEKVLHHQYDLKRLEDVLKKEEHILCVFQPIEATEIALNGICSGSRGRGRLKKHFSNLPFKSELQRGVANTPPSLARKVTFFPRLRLWLKDNPQELLKTAVCQSLAAKLVELNSIVSKEYFVLPLLFSPNKKTLACQQKLLEAFQVAVHSLYPKAEIGFELAAGQHKFIQQLSAGCNFVSVHSSVHSDTGITALQATISTARANDLEVYCLNALHFVENKVFAATLVREPVQGFSFYHGGLPWKEAPYYYNPCETISRTNTKGKTMEDHYWAEQEMRNKYSSNMLLSDLCSCAECGKYSVNEWFNRGPNEISQSNLRHKSLLLEIQTINEWTMYLKEIAQVEKPLEKQLSEATVALARTTGQKHAQAGPVVLFPPECHTVEQKIIYLARNKQADAVLIRTALPTLPTDRLVKTLQQLLIAGEIKHNKRQKDGMLFFTA